VHEAAGPALTEVAEEQRALAAVVALDAGEGSDEEVLVVEAEEVYHEISLEVVQSRDHLLPTNRQLRTAWWERPEAPEEQKGEAAYSAAVEVDFVGAEAFHAAREELLQKVLHIDTDRNRHRPRLQRPW
jgi:hypothetical protein